VLVKLYADWAGAITKLVEGSQIVAGFWGSRLFESETGSENCAIEDGED
jgi:hypothetical protein